GAEVEADGAVQAFAREVGARRELVAARAWAEQTDVRNGAGAQRLQQLEVLQVVVRHDHDGVELGRIERLARADQHRVPTELLSEARNRLRVAAAAEDGDGARRLDDLDQRSGRPRHRLPTVPTKAEKGGRMVAVERLDVHVRLA